jgi:hypothetical protein
MSSLIVFFYKCRPSNDDSHLSRDLLAQGTLTKSPRHSSLCLFYKCRPSNDDSHLSRDLPTQGTLQKEKRHPSLCLFTNVVPQMTTVICQGTSQLKAHCKKKNVTPRMALPFVQRSPFLCPHTPVIPPRRFAEVKGSPRSRHIASTLRRCLDEQPLGYSRHDLYFFMSPG